MINEKMKDLEAARVKVAELEQLIADELRRELASLPGRYGFGNVSDFLKAVRRAIRGGVNRAPVSKRKRPRISDATKAKVKRLVQEGKTGIEIARTVGISLPSVQNIKKAFGLVRSR